MVSKRVSILSPFAVLLVTGSLFAESVNLLPGALTRSVQPLDPVSTVILDGIDLQAALAEDGRRDRMGGPYRFAVRRDVMVTPQTSGVWEDLGDGLMLWRVPIISPGATSLSLGFTRYSMPTGGRLLVYSSDYAEALGPYTAQDNRKYAQLWTPLLYCDSIIVEVTIPLVEIPNLKLELTAVNHGYRENHGHSDTPRSAEKELGDSADCNVDVCSPLADGYRDQIRSVARFYATGADGQYWGTGALINNTAEDGKPYFLTAFHIFDEDDDGVLADPDALAQTMVLYWNFQRSEDAKRYEYTPPDVPKAIPDLGTIESSLVLSQSGTITDLNVRLDIEHTWVQDLDVFLIGPDGTQVELFTDVGDSALCEELRLEGERTFSNIYLDDEAAWSILWISAPNDWSYRPEGNLAALYGKNVAGTWTLRITDDSAQDGGVLNSWSLIINAPEKQTQTGAMFRAAYQATDFCLVELADMPPAGANVYYAGWDRSAIAPSSAVTIHHPESDLKKISIENDPLYVSDDGTHLMVADWDVGTTEGGSSGSPLFDANKRIVGQLHAGDAACGNDEPDWFGRLHMSWTGGGTPDTRLSDWLDPLGTNATVLNGENPGDGYSAVVIGDGAFAWDYPMHTFYHDSRTQVIYLASEIGRSGEITELALDVSIAPGQPLDNWTIRMKHTDQSSYSSCSLETSGWTVVYQNDVGIDSTGWVSFPFQTPFQYDGVSNLLVDFSHNNSSYSGNGECRASRPGGHRSACGCSDSNYGDPLLWSATSSANLFCSDSIPNIKFAFGTSQGSSIVGTWTLWYCHDGVSFDCPSVTITFTPDGTFTIPSEGNTGTWTQSGNSVSWTFAGGFVYTGTLSSATSMSGTMGWSGTWNATRQ